MRDDCTDVVSVPASISFAIVSVHVDFRSPECETFVSDVVLVEELLEPLSKEVFFLEDEIELFGNLFENLIVGFVIVRVIVRVAIDRVVILRI